MMEPSQTFRECISSNDNECLIYGADNLSQFAQSNGHISSKCDRALAAARSNDVVVLRGKPGLDYQTWLRSLGLGTDHIVAYDGFSGKKMLSQLIVENPEPVKRIIRSINKSPVYVPWFSGETEEMAAKTIGADLFGAPAVLTWKYNDKSIFKKICRQLNIPVVEDTLFSIHTENKNSPVEMENIIRQYLSEYQRVLIRGTQDNKGVSLVFNTNGNDIHTLCRKICRLRIDQVLIEPCLNFFSSPNDQWIITRERKICHVGILDQILKDMHHIGNIKMKAPFPVETDYIFDTSLKIVQDMADSGYIGVIGIDYIVTDSGVYPVENNARFNGSSYMKIIMDNIEDLIGLIPCWKSIKVKIKPCSYNTLAKQITPILFDGRKSESVFPCNCDELDTTGDFAVILLAPDLKRIADLEQTLNDMGVE